MQDGQEINLHHLLITAPCFMDILLLCRFQAFVAESRTSDGKLNGVVEVSLQSSQVRINVIHVQGIPSGI